MKVHRRVGADTRKGLGLFVAALVVAGLVPLVSPAAEPLTGTLEVRVAASSDDAEELSNGFVDLGSSDLELTVEQLPQTVGMRFAGLDIPAGATITKAWVQFTVDETSVGDAQLTIAAQAVGDAAPFAGIRAISTRPTGPVTASWNPGPWTTVGAAGADQRTPDISAVVQAVVSRSDWASGNALVLVVTGAGTRTAESYDGSPTTAPLLHVEWSIGGSSTTTTGATTTTTPPTTTTTTPTGSQSASIPIVASTDDAEELITGYLDTFSSDLELVDEKAPQTVGLRFAGLPIPQGATVTSAWVQFTVDESSAGTANLTIAAHDAGNAPTFGPTDRVASRPRTAASVAWTPPPWSAPGPPGPDHRTPDLASIIQSVVGRTDWAPGNAVALIVTGTGTRTAVSYDGGPALAPVLHVTWTTGGATTTTTAPTTTTTAGTTTTTVASTTTTVAPTTTTSAPTTTTTAGTTTTTPASAGVVRLAVIGDYGDGKQKEAAVSGMIAGWDPDAVVTVGDNVYWYTGYDRLVGRYYYPFIGDYTGTYGTGSPVNRFFPSLGNHDYKDAGLPAYLDFFTLPGAGITSTNTSGNERYYDARIGDVHLFILNSNPEEPDGIVASSVQAAWLQSAMALSNAEWKIVVFHHSSLSSIAGKSANWMRWPFATWGADLLLAGDAHVYERLEVDGLPLVISGLGVNNSTLSGPTIPESRVFYSADDAGAVLLTACDGALRIEYRAIGAGLIDSYTIGTGTCP